MTRKILMIIYTFNLEISLALIPVIFLLLYAYLPDTAPAGEAMAMTIFVALPLMMSVAGIGEGIFHHYRDKDKKTADESRAATIRELR